MTRILLSGCCGKMGHVVADIISSSPDCEIVGGIDLVLDASLPFPVFSAPGEVNVDADAIIDFSNPSCLIGLLTFAADRKIPAVIATTGLSAEQKNFMYEASKKTAVFFSANMSLGVNLIADLSKKAVSVLEDGFDIEILEAHHNRKLDAPSGTALFLADSINDACREKKEYVYDRHSVRKKRDKREVGIHSVRGGTIVGEHTVIFAGNDEIIEIKHTALSRGIFAEGAVAAAKFICGKQSGMYDMDDLISAK